MLPVCPQIEALQKKSQFKREKQNPSAANERKGDLLY